MQHQDYTRSEAADMPVKKAYAAPMLTEHGTMEAITLDLSLGVTSDCLGSGFDPDTCS